MSTRRTSARLWDLLTSLKLSIVCLSLLMVLVVACTLAQTRPDELAGQVVRALLARVPQVKPADVEDIVLGCAMPEGEQGLNIARVVGLLSGCPEESSASS